MINKKIYMLYLLTWLCSLNSCTALTSGSTLPSPADVQLIKLQSYVQDTGIKVSRLKNTHTFKFILPIDAAFAKNSAQLPPRSYQPLIAIARILKANPKLSAKITGHTDIYGTLRYNQLLSEKRAENIADYLASQGIEKNRLQTAGYGINDPIASNKSRQGRAQNRRIEIILY